MMFPNETINPTVALAAAQAAGFPGSTGSGAVATRNSRAFPPHNPHRDATASAQAGCGGMGLGVREVAGGGSGLG